MYDLTTLALDSNCERKYGVVSLWAIHSRNLICGPKPFSDPGEVSFPFKWACIHAMFYKYESHTPF